MQTSRRNFVRAMTGTGVVALGLDTSVGWPTLRIGGFRGGGAFTSLTDVRATSARI
jgi:hypothetical protein